MKTIKNTKAAAREAAITKPTKVLDFTIPFIGNAHPPLVGQYVVLPEGAKAPPKRRGRIQVEVTRYEWAKGLRRFRRDTPDSRYFPKFLVAAAIAKGAILRGINHEFPERKEVKA